VQGEPVHIGEDGEELGSWADLEKVRTAYKLGGVRAVDSGSQNGVVNGAHGDSDERKEMEAVILGVMTIKGS
jgi:EKC/KEOPS complex subunit CGI121/TPRKB